MDMYSKKQYLQEVQRDYLKANKKEKIQLLDEAVKRTQMDRKYIIKKLSPKTRWQKQPRKVSSKAPEYGSDLIYPLVQLWDIFDEPCGQRLEPLIKVELDRLRDFEEIFVSNEQAQKLKKMSAKTIDRLLEHEKSVRLIEAKYAKKNNPLLYQKIPTKLTDEWDRTISGQIQIDGVEHCGRSAAGEYLNTISHTDIASHWWEGEAVMGKGKRATVEAIDNCRARFPFSWIEIHPDNGSSFINYFLWDYASQTPKLEFSRSRPLKKNDNCFVEQKNSQNVRKVVGHIRYDTKREQAILNDLYRNELRLYKNYFQPVMRLKQKERAKGHIYRKYQKAKTPYQWLMDDPNTPDDLKQKLECQYQSLNPAKLKRDIEQKLKLLIEIYTAKQHHASQKLGNNEDGKVSFLFDPTNELKCHVLMT
jgi:hypothetical protein